MSLRKDLKKAIKIQEVTSILNIKKAVQSGETNEPEGALSAQAQPKSKPEYKGECKFEGILANPNGVRFYTFGIHGSGKTPRKYEAGYWTLESVVCKNNLAYLYAKTGAVYGAVYRVEVSQNGVDIQESGPFPQYAKEWVYKREDIWDYDGGTAIYTAISIVKNIYQNPTTQGGYIGITGPKNDWNFMEDYLRNIKKLIMNHLNQDEADAFWNLVRTVGGK